MSIKDTFCVDSSLEDAVIGTLGYYSLFKYPIKTAEILGNLPLACTLASLEPVLAELTASSTIYHYDGYYSLGSDVQHLVTKRLEANQRAVHQISKALKVGSFIYKFPFVRFVGISGSLSKGYADQKSDLDFFIVTEVNRLWICRTLLHLFKKTTYLTGTQHNFCMNYFIDTHNLQIEEKNRYTAIELASMIPVAGITIYEAMKNANQWKNAYLPNSYYKFSQDNIVADTGKSVFKKVIEGIINACSPEKINGMLMKFTDKKWRKKWAKKNYPMTEYDIAFKTTMHISKNHPANHQKIVLKALKQFEK